MGIYVRYIMYLIILNIQIVFDLMLNKMFNLF